MDGAAGFACVSFYNVDGGRKALELNGVELKGGELNVKEPNNNWENKRTGGQVSKML